MYVRVFRLGYHGFVITHIHIHMELMTHALFPSNDPSATWFSHPLACACSFFCCTAAMYTRLATQFYEQGRRRFQPVSTPHRRPHIPQEVIHVARDHPEQMWPGRGWGLLLNMLTADEKMSEVHVIATHHKAVDQHHAEGQLPRRNDQSELEPPVDINCQYTTEMTKKCGDMLNTFSQTEPLCC